MTFSEIARLHPGHPLRVDGETVYLRSARLSPHTGTPLAIVADIAGGVFAVEVEYLSRDCANCEGAGCNDCDDSDPQS